MIYDILVYVYNQKIRIFFMYVIILKILASLFYQSEEKYAKQKVPFIFLVKSHMLRCILTIKVQTLILAKLFCSNLVTLLKLFRSFLLRNRLVFLLIPDSAGFMGWFFLFNVC